MIQEGLSPNTRLPVTPPLAGRQEKKRERGEGLTPNIGGAACVTGRRKNRRRAGNDTSPSGEFHDIP